MGSLRALARLLAVLVTAAVAGLLALVGLATVTARLVYLRQAGHNAYQDQPADFLAVVRAFLAGRPSPVPAWTGDGVPDDYEGRPRTGWPPAGRWPSAAGR